MRVEVLTADDWKLLQDLRLSALDESPAAFLPNADATRAGDEAYWRTRCTEESWVVALIDQQAVGIARSVQDPAQLPDSKHIESVWVDPAHRRQGVLRTMLHRIMELEPDVQHWYVWVLDGNDLARESYESLGFETAERHALAGTLSKVRLKLGPSERWP
ncbi:GNAT family N-acetyltransferase [Kribbella sp. NPDC051770]|uniref:GNAT family N-acetyltransferase n=1 Tax=Kribbella sp. NPDC051770 TaxID=3155413 RepID=UPI00343179E3